MKHVHSIPLAIALVACQSPAVDNPVDAPLMPTGKAASTEASAALGVRTDVPSPELAREMELDLNVRLQGRLVKSMSEESAAYAAGIRTGDVLLQLGDVALYSQDDIDDFVSVHEPGDEVPALIVRSESYQREEFLVELGSGAARPAGRIDWQYASLAQLPAALEQARAEKKKVLVGLSGAET